MDSNFLKIIHNVASLGNLSVNRLVPSFSVSGSCKATDTTEGEREEATSSNLAPDSRPANLIVRERSMFLLLYLRPCVNSSPELPRKLHLLKGELRRVSAKFLTRFLEDLGKLLVWYRSYFRTPGCGVDDYNMGRHT